MSHEIEANFVEDWYNEKNQCKNCTSFVTEDGNGFCTEAKDGVSPTAHCDFFQSRD